jgi:hypothetical protein
MWIGDDVRLPKFLYKIPTVWAEFMYVHQGKVLYTKHYHNRYPQDDVHGAFLRSQLHFPASHSQEEILQQKVFIDVIATIKCHV